MEAHLRPILALLFLIVCSAFTSASETSMSSVSRTRLKAMAQGGNKKAARTLALSENYDRMISTILIGNNVVNILSSSIATVLFVSLLGERYGTGVATTVSTVVMTVLILIFGEISPKILAKENAEQVALAVTPLLSVIVKMMTPLSFFFDLWKKLLGKIFKLDNSQTFTEEELILIVDEVESDGGINEAEGSLIRAAIEFNDLSAEDILTHRVDIAAIGDTAKLQEIIDLFGETGYSRLPVYHDTIDNILGVVLEKDFYRALQFEGFELQKLIKQPLFITKNTKISALMKQLQQSKTHMAIVVDEFGGTYGLVTLEDILEELVGDIWDEHDEVTQDIRPMGSDVFVVSCSADLDDLFEHFEIDMGDYDAVTVGGWVMQELGKIAEVGDSFSFEGLLVRVTEVDQRRPVTCEIKTAQGSADNVILAQREMG